MTSVTLRLKWCAAHRLIHHRGKCFGLHGHNYQAELTYTARHPELGKEGMVIDFGVIKETAGKWIDGNWDHRPILNKDDHLLRLTFKQDSALELTPDELKARFGVVPFVMDCEPTAENMAAFLMTEPWFGNATLSAPSSVVLSRVTVWETDTSSATVEAYL